MNGDYDIEKMNELMTMQQYLSWTMGAVLGSLGVFIDVHVGNQPGDVIIEITGLPPNIDREIVIKLITERKEATMESYLNREVAGPPLTDNVIVKFNPPTDEAIRDSLAR